jgi:hypothetical protein
MRWMGKLLFFAMVRIFCHSVFSLSHPVSQVAVGGHFVFVGVIGGVVDGCVCGCGFTINVNFYFVGFLVLYIYISYIKILH